MLWAPRLGSDLKSGLTANLSAYGTGSHLWKTPTQGGTQGFQELLVGSSMVERAYQPHQRRGWGVDSDGHLGNGECSQLSIDTLHSARFSFAIADWELPHFVEARR